VLIIHITAWVTVRCAHSSQKKHDHASCQAMAGRMSITSLNKDARRRKFPDDWSNKDVWLSQSKQATSSCLAAPSRNPPDNASRRRRHVRRQIRAARRTTRPNDLPVFNQLNPLMGTCSYSATANNMKLIHWPLMGGLLHLVQ